MRRASPELAGTAPNPARNYSYWIERWLRARLAIYAR